MQPDIKISIALAVYNGEKYLPELLISLENQIFQPTEIIILDDGSTDNSMNIINAFTFSVSEKRVFKNDTNKGVNYTFKKLVSLCKENFVAFCDQDDIWKPEKLKMQVEQLAQLDNTIPGVVFSDLELMDENGKLPGKTFWDAYNIAPAKFCFADILFSNVITGCACVINQPMKNEIKKMPADAVLYDHWIALITYSFGKYNFTNTPLINYRVHAASVTNKTSNSFSKIFFNDYKNKKDFEIEYIRQAKAFLKTYAEQLNEKQADQIHQFILLERKSFFAKWLSQKKRVVARKLKNLA